MTQTDSAVAVIASRVGDVLFNITYGHPEHVNTALRIAEAKVDELLARLAQQNGWTEREVDFRKQQVIDGAMARIGHLVTLATPAGTMQ